MARTMVPLILLAMLLPTSGAALAQGRFAISVERPDRTLDTADFTTFEIRVHSLSDDTLRIRMARLVDELPDTSWHTSICSMTTCYPESVSVTEAELVEPRGLTGFTVHVISGGRYGDTARLLLRVDAGDGADSILQQITIATAPPPRRLFRVEPETLHRSGVSGDTVSFTTWVYNEASDTLRVSVGRIDDFFPDTTWSSRLCVEDRCYDPGVDAPPSVLLDNDRATWFTLRITGRTPGTGRVVLRFNTMRSTEPIEQRFTVDIGAASIAGTRELSGSTVAPLPATSSLTIALGERAAGRELRLRVVDAAGRLRHDAPAHADSRGRLRLAVDALEEGVYRYVIEGGISATGSFIVAR